VQADFIVETSPATRKTQCFADFDENRYFYPDWDISAFKRSIRSILRVERSAGLFHCWNKPSKSQNAIFLRFRRKLLLPSWLRYLRLNAQYTPFYVPNAVQADFSVETSPATRKTQSFLDYIQKCYIVSDWDISVFFRSFHSILRSERSAGRFHCWNKPSNSQNSILPRFRRKLLFPSWLRYFGV
jgi:hypothetical protein